MEDLRSVFSMHPETVLLVTRADTGINTVWDLKGKTVNIGNPGSGQRGNAEDVLRYGSLTEAYTFLKGDPDLLMLYQQRYESALQLLVRESDGRDRTDAYRTGQPSLVA